MAHSPREDFTASLTRPKLDATLVLPSTEVRQEASPRKHTLFALASLNSRTAPSAEVSWSQLLALSLKPEREPVLAVGRHKDCHISVSDPRVSVNHFEILAKQAACKGQNMSYECVLVDRSSNGTTVNGTVVGRGQSRPLHTGDQIEVLPTSRVGDGEMVAFLFHNTSESLAFGESTAGRLEELVLCPICMQPMYKCVALLPCSHNFCMACCSDWMGRKTECPICRRRITAVMKNHPMDAVVEAFLAVRPERRRPSEELAEMDERDKLRLGNSGKLVRDFCTFAAPPRPAPGGPAQLPAGGEAEGQGQSAQDGRDRAVPRREPREPREPRELRERGRASSRLGSQVCSLQ